MKVVSEIFNSKPDSIQQAIQRTKPNQASGNKNVWVSNFDNFMQLETEGSDKWVQLRYSTCHLLNIVWHATVWISSLTNHKFNQNI